MSNKMTLKEEKVLFYMIKKGYLVEDEDGDFYLQREPNKNEKKRVREYWQKLNNSAIKEAFVKAFEYLGGKIE